MSQNTFQAVLATDGVDSFLVYNYFNMSWPDNIVDSSNAESYQVESSPDYYSNYSYGYSYDYSYGSSESGGAIPLV